ncbi:putative flavin reductase like domain containing protein [Lyophyllum shimeji]|uniref:Flavin reductase like domain containing protein n=1 Tax=Lyophyllum shimeji TaxID=47721 RepID=A0A9P3PX70_LYOSH|nr:putative flavin reductase like domain containing protein [Lyophyllum shimeji]
MADILKNTQPEDPSHMVVNILSAAQAEAAVQFSRADLYPEPFASVPYCLSKEGQPVLEGSLGALSCRVVGRPLPLYDLGYLEGRGRDRDEELSLEPEPGGAMASELFIARVLRVETLDTREEDAEDPRTLPLLYHRRAQIPSMNRVRRSTPPIMTALAGASRGTAFKPARSILPAPQVVKGVWNDTGTVHVNEDAPAEQSTLAIHMRKMTWKASHQLAGNQSWNLAATEPVCAASIPIGIESKLAFVADAAWLPAFVQRRVLAIKSMLGLA